MNISQRYLQSYNTEKIGTGIQILINLNGAVSHFSFTDSDPWPLHSLYFEFSNFTNWWHYCLVPVHWPILILKTFQSIWIEVGNQRIWCLMKSCIIDDWSPRLISLAMESEKNFKIPNIRITGCLYFERLYKETILLIIDSQRL